MRTSMQEKISPYQGKGAPNILDGAGPSKISSTQGDATFKNILMSSNLDVAKERASNKEGDLSAAKTDEDFFRALNGRNNTQRGPKNELDKDDFLKLFIAQLQNQDPLKPDDSAQMAAQLAQFNGLEQMLNVNKTLTEMLKGQSNGRNFGMLDYVGRDVTVEGGRALVSQGNAGQVSFNIDRPVTGATLEVRDGNGNVVATEDLGQLADGEQNLQWSGVGSDGKPLQDGAYTFSITATADEGQTVPVPVQTRIKVTGVDLKDPSGAFMTPAGKISASDVVAVRMIDEKPKMNEQPKSNQQAQVMEQEHNPDEQVLAGAAAIPVIMDSTEQAAEIADEQK